MLVVLLLLAALVFWALRGGGSGPTGSSTDDSAGGGPAPSITPGETSTESVIDERPGGTDDTGGGDADGDGDENGDGGDGDGSADGGDADGGGASEGDGAGGAVGDAGGDGDTGDGGGDAGDGGGNVSGLPDCAPGEDVKVSLRSEENAYGPDGEPTLRLTVTNDGPAACKADFGHRSLTVELSTGDDRVWTSAHCPSGRASAPAAVPAGSSASHVIEWDRRYSSRAECDGPDQPSAPTGTYLAEATLAGFPVARTTFRLDED